MEYRCFQNSSVIEAPPAKEVSLSITSAELQELLVPIRNQLRQEILTEVQGYIADKFVALRQDCDKTFAKNLLQIDKLSCLEKSVEDGLAIIHATQRSLTELADDLELNLSDTMYQKISDMAAVKDEIHCIHSEVQKWSEYQKHVAQHSEDYKALLAENSDNWSTRSPSDDSDETVFSGEERPGVNKVTSKTTPGFLKGNSPPAFQFKSNKRACLAEHSNLGYLANTLAPDERSAFEKPTDMRLNRATSESTESLTSSETCTKDLRKTIAHLMPRLRESLTNKPIHGVQGAVIP